jgi:dihydrodipicolinate synthase/N-acetylneuraminate lyase
LTENELNAFIACVVETVARRRPVFAGITTLNTRDTIRRARKLVDIGADGLFVGRPMWIAMDDKAIVRYYQDIAEALPGVPMCIYDNPSAFKGSISADVYDQLAAIPEIVASKHVTGPTLEKNLERFGHRIRILPLEIHWYDLAKKYPDKAEACWSGGIACAAAPTNALARAIEARDWTRAGEIAEQIKWAVSPMFEGGGLASVMDYSVQFAHARVTAAGLIDAGPPRPPYLFAPEEQLEGSRETGRRWAVLQQQFTQKVAAPTL